MIQKFRTLFSNKALTISFVELVFFYTCLLIFPVDSIMIPYEPYLILILAGLIIWLYKLIGKGGTFASIVIAHFLVVFGHTPNAFRFMKHYFLHSGLIVFLFLLTHGANLAIEWVKNNPKFRFDIQLLFTKKRVSAILGIVLLSLYIDTTYWAQKSRILTRGEVRHDKHLEVKSIFGPPSAPKNRFLYSKHPGMHIDQSVRNIGLLDYNSYVLSPVLPPYPYAFRNYPQSAEHPYDKDYPSQDALGLFRWTTLYINKGYATILKSIVEAEVIESLFAVGRPSFQYRSGYIVDSEGNLLNYLIESPKKETLPLLESVLLFRNTDQLPPTKYKKTHGNFDNRKLNKEIEYSLLKFSPNHIRVEVDSPKNGLLYWVDGYNEHWSATNNGIDTPIYRANLNFKSVELNKGKNLLEFHFRPENFVKAISIFNATFLFCFIFWLLSCCFSWFRQVRNKGSLAGPNP